MQANILSSVAFRQRIPIPPPPSGGGGGGDDEERFSGIRPQSDVRRRRGGPGNRLPVLESFIRRAQGGVPQGGGRREAGGRRPTGRVPRAPIGGAPGTPQRFFAGDEWQPADKSPQDIAQLQRKLVDAGLLGAHRKGVWDAASRQAYAEILAQANASDVSADTALQLYLAGEQADPTRPGLVMRVQDPDAMREVFRSAVINTLGQGWTQNDINAAVMTYTALQQERQRREFDALMETGQAGGGAGPFAKERTVVDIPSPEAFIQSHVRQKDPEGIEDFEALNFVDQFMANATNTAWGAGGSVGGFTG